MNKKYKFLEFFLMGILLLNMTFGLTVAVDEKKDENPDEPKDDKDNDGIKDEVEDETKRDIEIWFGENVIEMASINYSEDKKDIMDLRIQYDKGGIKIRVSFRALVKINCTDEEEDKEECIKEDQSEKEIKCEDDCTEWIVQSELMFEVRFIALIEYLDLNDNGIFEDELDECIEEYGINSFQSVIYEELNISDESKLHYFLLNTTDSVFATHIYFPEEFVFVNETLVAPTQIKVAIEITNYDYIENNSRIALYTKLISEGLYEEREETEDEKQGYAEDEKEVFVENEGHTGIFSWKETAIVDGVEMPVLTNQLDIECKEENIQKLLFNYPHGYHIFHDPKIGIILEDLSADSHSRSSIIIIGPIVGVAGFTIIAMGIFLKKRRII
ncbi:MAG: hypothetical protein ACFFHD_05200 [Promethearchaeota archaeon]